VHYSVLVEDETLEQGEEVEFEIGEGPKGPMAIKVVKV
jgi:cold shock CspA family protein